jgi:hypothetical protein
MRTISKTACAILLALGSASSLAATSTFSTDAEGWFAQGDTSGPLTWVSSGGNPGGHVRIADAVTGGVTYFVAPAAFLGNQSAAFGTNLTFDLQQTYPGGANQFDSPDVILQGAGLTLVFDTAFNPANGAWTSYSVGLSGSGWRLNDLSGAAASNSQLAAVLSNLNTLKIRAEYQTGADTGMLDNVSLVPEPGTYAMFAAGLLLLSRMTRRRKGT